MRHIPSGGWGRRGESQLCLQWGMLSDTCPNCQMSLVWDGRGDKDLWHVCSGGRSVIHVPIAGDGGGKQDF